ncbi:HAMP domain-containing protein [Clostridioides sp. ZZV14-6154]|nr:HAMP domain-containing protein [Clostridioides sp. ZZV14-6154]
MDGSSHPMGKLIESIEKIRDGDTSIRFNNDKNNEYTEIATAFNNLIDTMVSNSEELKRINDDLEVLTANIPGGVYKYSCDGNYIFSFIN